MKRIVIFILSLLMMMCLLTGCGSGDTTNDKTPTEPVASDDTDAEQEESKQKSAVISVDEQVIFDSCGVTATLKSYDDSALFGPEFKILVENNSDKSIYFQCEDIVVNGYNVTDLLSIEVAPGKKANGELTIMSSDLENCGIGIIKDVKAKYYLLDADSWNRIGEDVEYEFSTVGSESYEQVYDDSGFVAVDQNDVKVVVKKLNSSDSFWGADIYVYIENNTDRDIYVQCDESSIDGFMMTSYFSAFVSSGCKTVSTITLMESELEENDITDIQEFETTFYALDANSWNRIFETDPVTISFN